MFEVQRIGDVQYRIDQEDGAKMGVDIKSTDQGDQGEEDGGDGGDRDAESTRGDWAMAFQGMLAVIFSVSDVVE